jgi:hypothetical protein
VLRRYFIVAFALCWAITLITAFQTQGLITSGFFRGPASG